MQPKLLKIKEYFENFNFQQNETGCGIEQEPDSGENYFWIQTFLPKEFFELDNTSLIFNPFIAHQIEEIPDEIQVKFELFGIGNLDDVEAFIFKPWVVNIDNPMLFQLLESFHLFFPSTLFYNLIMRLIFLEQINSIDFKHIRVLQDIPYNTFQNFGLDRINIPKVFKAENLEILRLENVDRNEISKFYSENWDVITPQLEDKYFRPSLNIWFRILKEELVSQLFGLKKSTINKTVGFIRLYNSNSSFSGGTSIEYIIDNPYRRKGYATQASLGVIQYLKEYSYAISLGAEVNDNNEFSTKVLRRLSFNESETRPFKNDNFELSLLANLKLLEENFDKGEIEVSVKNKYKNKYSRYF